MAGDRHAVWRFVGLCWRRGHAFMTFVDAAGHARGRPAVVGREVGLRVEGPRCCLGVYDPEKGARRPCPDGRAPIAGGQCRPCASDDPGNRIARDQAGPDGTFPAGVFRLYLASFGATTLKVGLTSRHRADDRLLEQGATAHLFVCEGSYLEIRQAERQLSIQLGIPEQVQWRRKRSLWRQPYDDQVLTDAADRARRLLADFPATVLPAQPVTENLSCYSLDPNALPPTLHVVTALHDGDLLTGRIVAVVGPMLLLAAGDAASDALLVLDTRSLEAWQARRCDPDQQWRLTTPPTREPIPAAAAQPTLFGG